MLAHVHDLKSLNHISVHCGQGLMYFSQIQLLNEISRMTQCYVLWDTHFFPYEVHIPLLFALLWDIFYGISYQLMNLQNQSAFIKEEKHRNHITIWCWLKSRVSQSLRINNIPWKMWLLSSYGIIDALVYLFILKWKVQKYCILR